MKKIYNILFIFLFSDLSYGQLNQVASYYFTGNTLDSSGNGHHLINNGATLTNDRFGKSNCAYHFDGYQYMHGIATTAFSSDKFTYAFWAKPEIDNPESARIISVGPPSTYWHYYCSVLISSINKFGLVGHNYDGSYSFYNYSNYEIDYNWVHVANVYNGDSIFIYINGVLNKKGRNNNSVVKFYTDKVLQIGAAYYPDAPHVGYIGDLDDIRFFSKALNSKEINEIYTSKNDTTIVKDTTSGKKNSWDIKIGPNPTNDYVKIDINLSENILFNAKLYNSIGQVVKILLNIKGKGEFIFNVQDFATGIYFIVLKDEKNIISETRKIFIY